MKQYKHRLYRLPYLIARAAWIFRHLLISLFLAEGQDLDIYSHLLQSSIHHPSQSSAATPFRLSPRIVQTSPSPRRNDAKSAVTRANMPGRPLAMLRIPTSAPWWRAGFHHHRLLHNHALLRPVASLRRPPRVLSTRPLTSWTWSRSPGTKVQLACATQPVISYKAQFRIKPWTAK